MATTAETNKPPDVFTLTLRAERSDSRPPITRLRAVLKFALRACGLRCVRLSPEIEGGHDASV